MVAGPQDFNRIGYHWFHLFESYDGVWKLWKLLFHLVAGTNNEVSEAVTKYHDNTGTGLLRPCGALMYKHWYLILH